MRRPQFDEPEDDAAVASPGPAHGPQTVEDSHLGADEKLVVPTMDRP